MRAFLWRHRLTVVLLSLPLVVTALVLQLLGHESLALLFMAGWMVTIAGKEVIDLRCKPDPPALSTAELAALRAEHASEGEIAAVRMLRAAYPDIGLLEAAARVRAL